MTYLAEGEGEEACNVSAKEGRSRVEVLVVAAIRNGLVPFMPSIDPMCIDQQSRAVPVVQLRADGGVAQAVHCRRESFLCILHRRCCLPLLAQNICEDADDIFLAFIM